MKPRLKDNDTEMYSTYNEGRSAVAERFTRTFKNKIYAYTTSAWLEYNNTYHKTTKTKPVDLKSSKYIDFNAGKNDVKILHLRLMTMSEYQNIIFA